MKPYWEPKQAAIAKLPSSVACLKVLENIVYKRDKAGGNGSSGGWVSSTVPVRNCTRKK